MANGFNPYISPLYKDKYRVAKLAISNYQGSLAQLVEHLPLKQRVPGSIPGGVTFLIANCEWQMGLTGILAFHTSTNIEMPN